VRHVSNGVHNRRAPAQLAAIAAFIAANMLENQKIPLAEESREKETLSDISVRLHAIDGFSIIEIRF
jgi:hypothetical protein